MRFHQAVTFLTPRDAVALAGPIDEHGYDGIYVSDHLFFPKNLASRYTYSTAEDGAPFWDPGTMWPDPWCFIAAMAAVTRRVRFTTGVYVAPARDLITVVKLTRLVMAAMAEITQKTSGHSVSASHPGAPSSAFE